MGSNGQQLGRIRVGFRVVKPIDKLLLAQHLQQQQHSLAENDDAPGQEKGQQQATGLELAVPGDAAALALQQAADQVGTWFFLSVLGLAVKSADYCCQPI